MKYILRQRLPERFSGPYWPICIEVLIGILAAVIAVGARIPLAPLLGSLAPYVFVFLAIVAASLLAGWRSGLVALVTGQILTWFILIEPQWSFAISSPERAWGLVFGTVSELLILIVVTAYQRKADLASAEREQRMDLLRQALREIDHRTKNNYQTVLALVRMQAVRARSAETREALNLAAERIEALALLSQQLSHRSEDLGTIRLADHLRELCAQVQRGLSREGVLVECHAEPVAAKASKAIGISIIVNELITNSLKHAFRERPDGKIEVCSKVNEGALELVVSDNGSGLNGSAPAQDAGTTGGLGTKLIESFVRQLGASHEVQSSDSGTMHKILIPEIA